ncbi:MAG: ATP-dependent RecD-like DNA helicase [Bacilli bacterium]|nr:ATP-dependent RecD-like DNA helicase [Bacilli bacterium]
MSYIKGKVRQLIFESDSGYKVGIIRIKESDDEELEDFINKTITFVGYFADLTYEDTYKMEGQLVYNDKYGYQYKVDNYQREEIEGKDAVLEFLSSPLVKGCGEKTAQKIVDVLGENALKLIKENISNLLLVPKMSEKKAREIYNSITKYQSTDDMIISLKKLGFSINESLTIINSYGNNSIEIFNTNPYILKDIIDFKKIDSAYLKSDNFDELVREKACLEQVIPYLEIETGNTYFTEDEILDGLKRYFNIILDYDKFINFLNELVNERKVVKKDSMIFSYTTFEDESYISNRLISINEQNTKKYTIFDTEIIKLQEEIEVTYNKDQLNAIRSSLESRVSIITGGPGTGKTTIVKAIVNLYIILHNLSPREIINDIALLAPTGRAAKKLAESTGLPASTIHRFLKWNKESNDFQVNEFNPNNQKLIIVDETSMIDTNLFASLLRGLNKNIQLILVGDANQLPSVGPGMVLNDLIASQMFTYSPLYEIYRQSINSYIPILASEIKNKELSDNFQTKKDDYNFLETPSYNIKETLKQICEMSISKNLSEKDIQVLAPMYKGENGIDNINVVLQSLFNPKSDDKKEIKIGEVIYREHDKVLQLVNDPDNLVFNGDIGYIKSIISITHPRKSEVFLIDFDGNTVEYKKEDMYNVKHAYAISIHKSQGSEFPHVIIPICKNYYKMLYNKLIYTGVSRAKKSLVIIGDSTSFKMAVYNDYQEFRKTNLLDKILHNI